MKKVLGWAVVIMLIFYVGTNPGPAAELAGNVGGGLATVFTNVGDFLVRVSR